MSDSANNLEHRNVRLVLVPAGSVRSETDLRRDVTNALREATVEFKNQRRISDVSTEATPEGGFLGLSAEWAWILTVVSPIAWELVKEGLKGAAEETGKEGAKSLFHYLREALRKKNVSVKEVEALPDSAKHDAATSPGSRDGVSTRKKKSKGVSRKKRPPKD
jgi:DNA replication initiation complex subunit (GINS family)